ncbi:MAG: hypothetical protein COB60_05705 [Flavobacteriaceae bacterium]|nr:MAG: hypothetical protein COB60_05705 [Flavobacteriaceae bacterium]
MSIAIIASFHIYHFVYKELSTDAFHTKRKDIYRLVNKRPNSNIRNTETYLPLGEFLKDKLPEVENYCRAIVNDEPLELHINESSQLEPFIFVDPSFFELFNFSLKNGSIEKFRSTPNGIVISEKTAKNLFLDENPIGRTILVSRYKNPKKIELQVTGVINNIPKSSTIQGNYFINISGFYNFSRSEYKKFEWFEGEADLYLYLPHLRDKESFLKSVSEVVIMQQKNNSHFVSMGPEDVDESMCQFEMQRLDNIYFNSSDIPKQQKKGDLQFINILVLVALLSLFLAMSNYIIMNLGLNLNRANEFKIRRFLGASKSTIFNQLIIESQINAVICFILSLLTYPIIGKLIAELLGFDYQLSLLNDGMLLLSYFILILTIGFIIGFLEFLLSYKSIFIKDNETPSSLSWLSKKLMIGFQLFLFISLIICILFVGKQITFIQKKDVGFNIRKIASVSTQYEPLINELESKSYVNAVARGQKLFRTKIHLEKIKIDKPTTEIEAIIVQGDADYLGVHNIELVLGKNLNASKLPKAEDFKYGRNKINRGFVEVLVNEEFVRKANLKNPLGTILKSNYILEVVIVGVIKDVYSTPLYNKIQPMVFGFDFQGYPNLYQISFDEKHKEELINFVQEFYINKGFPQKYLHLAIDTYDYKDIYKKEIQLKRLLQAFTIIVLFITLLGMIAISLFITESKTKEIGIRKVNGATIKEIMFMLNIDFIKWVGIAFVIACPIAYYAMSKWLENFAYKTSLSWWVFALAGLFTLIIALLTVSWQSWRAATRNPVEALRDE